MRVLLPPSTDASTCCANFIRPQKPEAHAPGNGLAKRRHERARTTSWMDLSTCHAIRIRLAATNNLTSKQSINNANNNHRSSVSARRPPASHPAAARCADIDDQCAPRTLLRPALAQHVSGAREINDEVLVVRCLSGRARPSLCWCSCFVSDGRELSGPLAMGVHASHSRIILLSVSPKKQRDSCALTRR